MKESLIRNKVETSTFGVRIRTLYMHKQFYETSRVWPEYIPSNSDGFPRVSEQEDIIFISFDVPINPAHSIAFCLNFLYSRVFAFCSTFSNSGIIEA